MGRNGESMEDFEPHGRSEKLEFNNNFYIHDPQNHILYPKNAIASLI